MALSQDLERRIFKMRAWSVENYAYLLLTNAREEHWTTDRRQDWLVRLDESVADLLKATTSGKMNFIEPPPGETTIQFLIRLRQAAEDSRRAAQIANDEQFDDFPIDEELATIARLTSCNRWLKDECAIQCGVPQEIPDGPLDDRPGVFFWKGKPFPLTSKNWSLACALWGEKSVDFATLGEQVWGDDSTPKGTIKSTVTRLNSELAGHSIPISWNVNHQRVFQTT